MQIIKTANYKQAVYWDRKTGTMRNTKKEIERTINSPLVKGLREMNISPEEESLLKREYKNGKHTGNLKTLEYQYFNTLEQSKGEGFALQSIEAMDIPSEQKEEFKNQIIQSAKELINQPDMQIVRNLLEKISQCSVLPNLQWRSQKCLKNNRVEMEGVLSDFASKFFGFSQYI
jgi:hypothetical protein